MRPTTIIEWVSTLSSMVDAASLPDGGFSVNPMTGESVTGGFAVSVHPDAERIVPVLTVDALAEYVASVSDELSLAGRVIGGWHNPDTGNVHLDVSIVVPARDAAMALAREYAQLAVFDFATGASVPTE